MRLITGICLSLLVAASALHAKPKEGGKYQKCQDQYDDCVDDIPFHEGTQSYNVAKSKCYKGWKGCVGIGGSGGGTVAALSNDTAEGDIEALEQWEASLLKD